MNREWINKDGWMEMFTMDEFMASTSQFNATCQTVSDREWMDREWREMDGVEDVDEAKHESEHG